MIDLSNNFSVFIRIWVISKFGDVPLQELRGVSEESRNTLLHVVDFALCHSTPFVGKAVVLALVNPLQDSHTDHLLAHVTSVVWKTLNLPFVLVRDAFQKDSGTQHLAKNENLLDEVHTVLDTLAQLLQRWMETFCHAVILNLDNKILPDLPDPFGAALVPFKIAVELTRIGVKSVVRSSVLLGALTVAPTDDAVFRTKAHDTFNSTKLVQTMEQGMDAFFIHFFSRFGNLNLVSIQPGANLVTLASSVAREVFVMDIRSLDMIHQFIKTLVIGENMVEQLYNVSARGDDCTIDTRMKSGQGWRGWILQALVTQLKYSNQEFAPAVALAADALYEFIAFFQVASAKVAKAYMMYSWEVVFYYNRYFVVVINSFMSAEPTVPTTECLAGLRTNVVYYYRGVHTGIPPLFHSMMVYKKVQDTTSRMNIVRPLPSSTTFTLLLSSPTSSQQPPVPLN
jgi:hypothetical protein